MYGLNKVIIATAAVAVAVVGVLPAFGQDPCSQTTKLSTTASGVQSWNGTKGATTVGGSGDDAYGVEAWTEKGGNATKLTWFGPNQGGGYAFRAEWTNSTDYLGRFGYFWGTNGKKWSNLGDLCVDYNYTRSGNGTGGSYSYIGIYGWTIGSGTSAEYYIVEDWFGSGQQGANNLGNNCQTHGNITVDGKTYQVVTCVRPQGSGCVSCNNQAFGQIFSIRQGMRNPQPATCGTISIKKHFEAWSNISAVSKYIYDKTYESKFLVEAQGGTGWFEASYMKFSRTGACGGTAPAVNFTLTTAVSPTGSGTITQSPTGSSFSSGTKVTLTPVAKTGYKFNGWSGDATGTASPLSVTMDKNKTVTATFVDTTTKTFTLTTTVSPTNSGTITKSPATPASGKYDSATVVKLTAAPATGYVFDGWDGDATGTKDTISVVMSRNKSVTAKFKQASTGIVDRGAAATQIYKMRVATLSNNALIVNFVAAGSGQTAVKLYNLRGDALSTATLRTVAGNSYTHTIDAGKLPGGFYVVGVEGGRGAEYTRTAVPK